MIIRDSIYIAGSWQPSTGSGTLAVIDSSSEELLGSIPDWSSLEAFLPDNMASPTERRAALASTLLASLEMARDGGLRLRQDAAFGPILLRSHSATPDTPQVANDA